MSREDGTDMLTPDPRPPIPSIRPIDSLSHTRPRGRRILRFLGLGERERVSRRLAEIRVMADLPARVRETEEQS